MARIPNLSDYNQLRKDLFKVQNESGDTIILSKEEAKEALVRFINEDLNLMGDSVTADTKKKLLDRVNFNLKQFENAIVKHIDDKFDALAEKIVSATLNRVMEEEIKRRVTNKLEEIKKQL